MSWIEISLFFAAIATLSGASLMFQEYRAQKIFLKWAERVGLKVAEFEFERLPRLLGGKKMAIHFSGTQKDGSSVSGTAHCGTYFSGVFRSDELEIEYN